MFPRIIMAILVLVFVPEPGSQNQQDCRDIESQLASCRKQLSGCEQQLKQANSDCQARLQEQTRELSQQAEARYGQLKAELTSVQGDFQKCQGGYNQLRVDLTRVQNDLQSEQQKNHALWGDLDGSTLAVKKLESENAQQKTSYEAQLAEKQSVVDAKTREIGDKNTQISNQTKDIARLNSANVGLSADVSKLGLSLKSAEQARIAADQATTDLKKNFELLSAEQKKKPEVVLGLIQDYQKKMDQSGAPAAITQGKDGSVKRELVIGTLEVKPYPAEIPAGGKLQLIAIFTPRPLPGTGGDAPWYVNLVYNPPPGINASYNQKESLGEEVREVHLGADHKWVWLVDGPTDSQAVLTATQIDILAGFQKDKVVPIAGQPVVLTRGKPAPGFFATVFGVLKENLTYILMTITTLFGIWAAFLTVKLKRVELAKTEKVETP